ncbi:MAG: hypothetical protein U0Y82_07035 [Thermoleophilia bacterium]
MTARTRVALAGAAALFTAVSTANATTAVLTLKPAQGFRDVGTASGVHVYEMLGMSYLQEFLVQVTDDAGAPVTGCLGTGGQVQLVDHKTGAAVSSPVSCATTDGVFHLFPTTAFQSPVGLVATVTASTLTSGTAASAATSGGIVITVSPRITDTSPSVAPLHSFPIRGKVDTPKANQAGKVALEVKNGRAWRRLATHPLPATGKYQFTVRDPGRYRVHFIGNSSKGYVDSFYTLRVRRL